VRAQVPEAQGFWPAFWLMVNNIATVNWPACGEMDVLERINAAATPDWNEGSIHGTGFTGGNLGTDGSVAYLFSKIGILSYAPSVDEDALMEAALEAGAEDVINYDDGAVDVMTTPENYLTVKDALIAAGFEPDNAEVTMQAATQAELDADDAEKMMRLIDRLEDLDDVQAVYSNADISDEIMEGLD